MSDRVKCKVCGRNFLLEETITSSVGFDFREKICPECKRARAFSGNGSSNNGNDGGSKAGSLLGGIAGGIVSAAAANKAATEASYERQKAEKKAENQAALDKLRTFSFSGDAQQISSEMEELYQIWISYNPNFMEKLTDNSVKTYVKLLEEKLDYGLMSLKSADATKGSYYEEKISKEKAKRKTFGYKLKCIFTN